MKPSSILLSGAVNHDFHHLTFSGKVHGTGDVLQWQAMRDDWLDLDLL